MEEEIMGFFETLLNLDCELSCLATKAFVAKEEFVDKVFYPTPVSKSSDKKEKEEVKKEEEKKQTTSVEVKSESNTTEQVTEETKKLNIKECVNAFEELLTRAAESESGKVMVDSLLKDMTEISGDLKTLMEKPEDEREKLIRQMQSSQNPTVNPPTQHVLDQQNIGMDYSNMVQGVSYGQPVVPVQQPVVNQQVPVQQPQQGQVVTQEHLDAIGLAKTMNASAIPLEQPAPTEKKKTK
jgi:hypothetical protein